MGWQSRTWASDSHLLTVFRYTHMHTHAYTYTRMHAHTHIHAYMHTHTHAHTAHLTFPLLTDTWAVSTFQLLWIVLLWTLGCMYLFRCEFLFLLGRCPGVGWLDDMVTLFFVFWGTSVLFFIVVVPVCVPRSVPFSPHPHQHWLFIDFWPLWDNISLDFLFCDNQWCWASLHVPNYV